MPPRRNAPAVALDAAAPPPPEVPQGPGDAAPVPEHAAPHVDPEQPAVQPVVPAAAPYMLANPAFVPDAPVRPAPDAAPAADLAAVVTAAAAGLSASLGPLLEQMQIQAAQSAQALQQMQQQQRPGDINVSIIKPPSLPAKASQTHIRSCRLSQATYVSPVGFLAYLDATLRAFPFDDAAHSFIKSAFVDPIDQLWFDNRLVTPVEHGGFRTLEDFLRVALAHLSNDTFRQGLRNERARMVQGPTEKFAAFEPRFAALNLRCEPPLYGDALRDALHGKLNAASLRIITQSTAQTIFTVPALGPDWLPSYDAFVSNILTTEDAQPPPPPPPPDGGNGSNRDRGRNTGRGRPSLQAQVTAAVVAALAAQAPAQPPPAGLVNAAIPADFPPFEGNVVTWTDIVAGGMQTRLPALDGPMRARCARDRLCYRCRGGGHTSDICPHTAAIVGHHQRQGGA